MDNKYIKMSDLVDQEFQVQSVGLYKYVAWDNEAKKFKTEDSWFQGASKKYPVTTNLGIVDMSATQVGNMLEGVMHAGQSDINGITFRVKSNGKTGMEIRYWISPVRGADKPAQPEQSGYEKAQAQANQLRPTGTPQTPLQTTEFSDADMPDFGDL